MSSIHAHPFGRHVRSLRRARGLTQDQLAAMSGLSADTIRRLEHGSFSPSLDTLRKLCLGLSLELSTLFEGYELNTCDQRRLLLDLIASRSQAEVLLIVRVIQALIEGFDQQLPDEPDPRE